MRNLRDMIVNEEKLYSCIMSQWNTKFKEPWFSSAVSLDKSTHMHNMFQTCTTIAQAEHVMYIKWLIQQIISSLHVLNTIQHWIVQYLAKIQSFKIEDQGSWIDLWCNKSLTKFCIFAGRWRQHRTIRARKQAILLLLSQTTMDFLLLLVLAHALPLAARILLMHKPKIYNRTKVEDRYTSNVTYVLVMFIVTWNFV